MKLSPRLKIILAILINQFDYITINTIANEMGLSSRTVLREIEKGGDWLSSQGVELDKRKSKGIRIIADEDKRKAIKKLLMAEETPYIYTPWERQVIATSQLLSNQEPVKLYSFTRIFDVTEGTISHDLDKVEKWLGKYEMELIRKPGLGIYLHSKEKEIRSAIVHLFNEIYKESHLLYMIKNHTFQENKKTSTKINNTLLELIATESLASIEELIRSIEESMGYKYADNAYIGLIMRIAITLHRVKKQSFIQLDPQINEEISKTKIYYFVEDWSKNLPIKHKIHISQEDISYISMHIIGAKVRDTLFDNKISMIEDYKLIKLAKKIIQIAEVETKSYLEDDEKLLIGLVRHLGPAIKRIKMNLEIQNSLLDEIKVSYPELFRATAKSVKVMEEQMNIIVPEAEIAYIATHIGAAMHHQSSAKKKKYLVAVACPNGIGASKLLASEIENEFPDIKIVSTISAIDINEDILKEMRIDFIISTIPIERISERVIVVNYILSKEDKMNIRGFKNSYLKRNYYPKKRKSINLKDKLTLLAIYSKSIIQIFNHFLLMDDVEVSDIQDLIRKVSQRIVKTEEKQRQLALDFRDREEKGATLLGEKGMMLLHCRSSVVEEIYFIVFRTKKLIEVLNKSKLKSNVNVIIVMVAPVAGNNQALEVLSEISKMIISSENFAKSIKDGVQEEIYTELSDILDNFYQDKTQL
ncbi:BglG family transcription antiterminator [Vallitalea okinawensis]|uniref:BglG family transcription antiterminator n=1 Tax=Vallitalea okinawensis TaxID=2078660 RepID=UPI000CFBE646|nr:BglG family transcription antiterminator [Vallitalea okinawensis]